ncbi:MAG: glycosyltransferase family 2 protein [Planctomycetes bacterium]|nr:glycosyltransferase family 2 protein [Planctomycetota bacterium]
MTVTVPDLVSTIIPVYNRPEMLREAVASVLSQTYRPIEVIVVDDGSTDDTPRVGEELMRLHPEVLFLRKPNSGAGPTREMGRLAARGAFIQYLDSDDLLRPTKFQIQVAALKANTDCGAAYGWICVHPIGRPALATPFKGSGDVHLHLFPKLLADRWWNTNSPILRRSVCDAVGPWSDLKWSQDWEYDGRVGALGTKLAYCAEWVTDERHHSNLRQTNHANWLEPIRLRERLRFLQMMFGHAERAGVSDESPERVHFTRWVFATARNCAATGLIPEAKACLQLADQSAGSNRQARRGLRSFGWMSVAVGWRAAGRLSLLGQRLKRPSSMTLTQGFATSLANK